MEEMEEKEVKEVKSKLPKIIEVECLHETSAHDEHFEKGVIYKLPENHPCMQYFKPVGD